MVVYMIRISGIYLYVTMDAESKSSKFKQEKMKYNMDFTFKPE